jgi:hypothetical protein
MRAPSTPPVGRGHLTTPLPLREFRAVVALLARRVGVVDYSTTPLTEPDVRARIRLLGSISKCQRELVGGP